MIEKVFRIMLLYLLSITLSFSLELSDKDFGEKIKVGKTKTREYVITNNSELEKEYYFSTTDRNVKISPKGFRLIPFESRKIKISAKPKKRGKYEYYLEIKEVIREQKENSVNINKLFRIRQEYTGV